MAGIRKLFTEVGLHPVGSDFIDRFKSTFGRAGGGMAARLMRKAVDEALMHRSISRHSPRVVCGARFSPSDAPYVVWEVRSLFIGLDEVPYAELFCASDPTLRKVVAQAALQDSKLFAPMAQEGPSASPQ